MRFFGRRTSLCSVVCALYGCCGQGFGYRTVSARPDAAVLCYPVITSGVYAHRDSIVALLGNSPDTEELKYMSLEYYVTKDTPPCFLWQTVTDATVPVENSYLFAMACRRAGVKYAHHVFSEGVHGMSVASEPGLKESSGFPIRWNRFGAWLMLLQRGGQNILRNRGSRLPGISVCRGRRKRSGRPR